MKKMFYAVDTEGLGATSRHRCRIRLLKPCCCAAHRPYLVGSAGGGLELVGLDGPVVKVRITGPAAKVMTVRVAVTQKLREKIPAIAAVQLVN